ncbi:MAG: T9SS type A sorting domain-containing protein, partial [Flavobacterium sp.]
GNVWFRVKLTSSPCSLVAFSAAVNVWLSACIARTEVKEVSSAPVAAFSAIAYPSPFTENFMLNVTTPSEDKVQVMVYDMIGKLVDQREVSPTDVATLEIGDRFPSGLYNVIVTQGDNTKTLRVIKR